MSGWWLLSLWVMSQMTLAAAGVINIAKREVLTDFLGGFCRSYRFGVDIADDTLYMVGLDGGLIPNDLNSSNNYLVTLDLTSSFSTSEGKNYKMSKIGATVPKVKDMALWSNAANTTLDQYGGRYLGTVTSENTVWKYTAKNESWNAQEGSVPPKRLEYGVDTNAPDIQAAFWIGGYRSSSTTTTITDSTEEYTQRMIQLNTTTGQYTSLSGPYDTVQEGSLSYIPVGDMGILVYIGGEVPSIQDGVNATLTEKLPVNTIIQMVPAAPLDEARMTLQCVTYGRQIFGVGGRLAWADDADAGCYTMPAFIYDAQSEATRSTFDPALNSYSLSSSTARDIKESPYPSSWASPPLRSLFVSSTNTSESSTSENSTNSSTTSQRTEDRTSHSSNIGAIAGGVVGGVAGVGLIIALIWYLTTKRTKESQIHEADAKPIQTISELSVGDPAELPAKGMVSELSSERYHVSYYN